MMYEYTKVSTSSQEKQKYRSKIQLAKTSYSYVHTI